MKAISVCSKSKSENYAAPSLTRLQPLNADIAVNKFPPLVVLFAGLIMQGMDVYLEGRQDE